MEEGCWFESRRGAEYFLVVGLFGPSANLAPDRTSSPLNLQQEVEVLKNSTLCHYYEARRRPVTSSSPTGLKQC